MLEHEALARVRERILRGQAAWINDLAVEAVEWETFEDSAGDLGLQCWVLLRDEVEPGVMSVERVQLAERELKDAASAAGLEGPCLLAVAMPDEADLLPTRRAEAAA